MSWIRSLIVATSLALAANAHALSFSMHLDGVYSGTAPASTTSPWLRATFEDIANGKVRITMEALNLTANEFIGSWYFNINPSITASSLAFKLDPLDPGLVVPDAINHTPSGQNYKAGPEKYFDIQFANETANSPDRFRAGERLIYDVGLIGGNLQASDFLYPNLEKSGAKLVPGDWYSAAHVQAIGTAGKSGWIGADDFETNQTTAVPDAGRTFVLLTAAFGGLLAIARYQKRESPRDFSRW